MNTQAKVIREYYVLTDGHNTPGSDYNVFETFSVYSPDLYWRAYELAASRRMPVVIRRMTEWTAPINQAKGEESIFSSFNLYDRTPDGENYTGIKETGKVIIGIPNFALDCELGRYDAVNGWSIPETVNVDLW